jgi:hypothetical protein
MYRWFGLPQKIISDRDPHFTSHFGQALAKELGIQQNLSTVFHPQTDGLSERKNQWVEQYLRLITTNQEEWSDWLPLATLAHNNTANSTTGFAPSQLLIGWEPRMTPEQAELSNNQTAEQIAMSLRDNRIMAIQALNRTANKNPTPDAKWKQGQMVWLEAKNLSLPYGTVKLAPRRHRPFQITKVMSPVAYQLELPIQWNIHPVFHASLLTPYIETNNHGPNFSRPPPDITIGENEYEVETIRSHRYFGKQKKLQYLLKWKGYPKSDNTWEPANQVHAPQLVKQYHARRPSTTIKTLLLESRRNHHSSPWIIPPHLPLRLRAAALTSPTSHSLSVRHAQIAMEKNSSGAYCVDPLTLPTNSRSSSLGAALTPLSAHRLSLLRVHRALLSIPRPLLDEHPGFGRTANPASITTTCPLS